MGAGYGMGSAGIVEEVEMYPGVCGLLDDDDGCPRLVGHVSSVP
jgi:hypothetical protein